MGVGGIEAEAVMLGEPSAIPLPEVIGVNLTGKLGPFATATDLALTVTKVLLDAKVVGKFVDFFGKSLGNLSLADRTTIVNMAPEYGATCGYFPIDEKKLDYLRNTNRKEDELLLIEAYMKANCLFYDNKTEPQYSRVIEIDLTTITSRMSGPSRLQDMVELADLSQNFETFVTQQRPLQKEDGRVAIATITSCTNTSNPHVMMMAELLSKNAVARGLSVPSYVKTSLAPGSKVVTAYLVASGLLPYLEKLGFHVVGYGCTTCIGNSEPVLPEMKEAVSADDLIVASVLSGNRNFEGRIHPLVKANYLASPPLVVAYALAGYFRRNLTATSLGVDNNRQDVFLSELMPTAQEVEVLVKKYVPRDLYAENYAKIFDENEAWNAIKTSQSEVYAWNENPTYISNPTYFETLEESLPETGQLSVLRVLRKFGDSITTDHISPAGNIPLQSPAEKYLSAANLAYKDFNSYGSRRGNDKVMTRGTFANVRIKNQLAQGQEGGYSQYNGRVLPVYDVAEAYRKEHTGLIILAGKDYGMGSSRDWAAKGTKLLGVKAVIAGSFDAYSSQ